MTLPALAHWLPYWTWRTVNTGADDIAVLVLTDGTLVTAFESTGVDVFAADNARLNRIATSLRRALNLLPADAFLQSEWHTGLSYDDIVAQYEARAAVPRQGGDDLRVLKEQRRWRGDALRRDHSLTRGRLVYFVGQRRALGLLRSHRAGGLAGILSRGRDPQSITPKEFHAAVARLAEVAGRIREELASIGASLRRLNAKELIAEPYRALNPVTSTVIPVHPCDRPEELPEALTREGAYVVHRPLSLREQLPLGDIAWTESSLTLDDPPVVHRVLSLERLPAFTRPDFMMGVQFRTPAHFRLVTTFVASDKEKLTERLIRKRNVAHAQAAGVVRDVAANVAFNEYERVLETMLTADQRVFTSSVAVVVSGTDHGALDQATREMKDAFGDLGAALTTETGRQLPAYLATLPGNGARAPKTHQLVTDNAADLVPYFAPSIGDDEAQLLYHTRHNTLRKVSFLPNKTRSNNNALVFGSSGSGKSFNVSCIFEQACLAEDGPLLIVDVQGPELSSYRVLAEALGGSYTALAYSPDVSFNPFFSHEDIRKPDGAFDEEAVRYLADLTALMALPDVAARADRAFAKEIARSAVLAAYAGTRSERRTPLLEDIVAELDAYEPPEPEYAALAREMKLKLATWLKDPTRARLLNRPSRFESARRMQVFDLFGLEKDKELATVLLLAVSFHIWSTIRRYARDVTKFVVFDECWKLLGDETASGIVAELFRTGRKWNASTWAITQSLADFLSSPIHSAILQNASLAFLLQHAGDHEQVADLLQLNARQLALFKQLRFRKGAFSEMLLVERGANDAAILKLKPTPFDLWLNTSDPIDVALRDRIGRERGRGLLDAVRHCARYRGQGGARSDAPGRRNGELGGCPRWARACSDIAR